MFYTVLSVLYAFKTRIIHNNPTEKNTVFQELTEVDGDDFCLIALLFVIPLINCMTVLIHVLIDL